jgi:hypothetical protein
MGKHNKVITNETCIQKSRTKFVNCHLTVSTDKLPSNPLLNIIALKRSDKQYSNDSYLITAVSNYSVPEVAITGFLFTFHTGYLVLYSAG